MRACVRGAHGNQRHDGHAERLISGIAQLDVQSRLSELRLRRQDRLRGACFWVSEAVPDTSPEPDHPHWRRGLFGSSARGVPHATEWALRHWSSRLLHRLGESTAHAWFGIGATLLVVGWAAVGLIVDFPGWWQTVLYSVTGSVTFVMVFVIQHTQQRQTAATQRKLDELLRSSEAADSTVIAVEEAPDEDLEQLTRMHVAEREQAKGNGA